MQIQYNYSIIAFDDLVKKVDNKKHISITDQIENYLKRNAIPFVSIERVVISAQDFINKMARVEVALCRFGSKAAAEKWRELNLPQ